MSGVSTRPGQEINENTMAVPSTGHRKLTNTGEPFFNRESNNLAGDNNNY